MNNESCLYRSRCTVIRYYFINGVLCQSVCISVWNWAEILDNFAERDRSSQLTPLRRAKLCHIMYTEPLGVPLNTILTQQGFRRKKIPGRNFRHSFLCYRSLFGMSAIIGKVIFIKSTEFTFSPGFISLGKVYASFLMTPFLPKRNVYLQKKMLKEPVLMGRLPKK